MTELTVFYRMCSHENTKLKPFKASKLELITKCYRSFLKAFERIELKVIFIIDKPTCELVELVETCPFKHEIETCDIGNVGTFHKQLEYAKDIEGNVLLLEDDYLWLPDSGSKFIDAMGVDSFVTPYDHPDYYRLDEHFLWNNDTSGLEILGGHHWHSVRSTTLTFGGFGETFANWYEYMLPYGVNDFDMWNMITSGNNGSSVLLSPIPSLATHVESDMLAPNIDWEEIWSNLT